MGIYDGPIYGQPLPPQARPTYTDQERRAARNQGLLALAAAIGSDAPLGQALAGGVSGGLSAESGYLARIMAERERTAALARQRMLEDFQAKAAERELAAKEDLWKHQGELRPLEIENTRTSIDSNRASMDTSRFSLEQAQAAAKQQEVYDAIFTPAEKAQIAEDQAIANRNATNRSGYGSPGRQESPAEAEADKLRLEEMRFNKAVREREERARLYAPPLPSEDYANPVPLIETAGPKWRAAYSTATSSGLPPAQAVAVANMVSTDAIEGVTTTASPIATVRDQMWNGYIANPKTDGEALDYIEKNNAQAYAQIRALVTAGKTDEAMELIEKYGPSGPLDNLRRGAGVYADEFSRGVGRVAKPVADLARTYGEAIFGSWPSK